MQHKHSIPSQYVPEKDYSDKDDLNLNLVPRITTKLLPACKSRKSMYNLRAVDKNPGFARPTVVTVCGSSNVSALEQVAKVRFNAAPKHRRPYLTYILEEVEVI